MRAFQIDPDIRKAKTLAADFYTDPHYFELSKEKIFVRSWQLVGHRAEMNDLTPATLLPGFADEPVVVTRKDRSFQCLSNVCTHRGKILVERSCRADLIRCRYHGRRFAVDGRFLSMPEFENVENSPSPADDLTKIATAELGGFIFASLNPTGEFNQYFDGVQDLFDSSCEKARLFGRREYEVNAHWALYCENYLEGFHIPFVHHDLNAIVDYGSYTTDLYSHASVQTGYGSKGDVVAKYLFIFPNLMFNFYPWGISVNVVRPIANDRTVVEFLTYVSDESLFEGSELDALHTVELEDESVVESVQKGVRSRFYSHGRYSPTREQGTHHFHRLIAEFMG